MNRIVVRVLVGLFAALPLSPAQSGEPPRAVVNSIGISLVPIPAGEFPMGSTESEIRMLIEEGGKAKRESLFRSEGPRHRVRITRPFHLGKTSVTIGQFRQFAAATSYKTEAERDGRGGFGMVGRAWNREPKYIWSSGAGFAATDDHPVVNVSWNDAVEFCEWLSRKEGATYRLPTEAEWEYACRAGSDTRADLKSARSHLEKTAWYRQNSDWKIHPVAQKQPNAFGLYDMIGNMRNWCSDWFAQGYYANSPVEDPTGPATGTNRIVRGCAFHADVEFARPAMRAADPPAHRMGQLGFRVLRER